MPTHWSATRMAKSGGYAAAWRLPALAIISALLVAAPSHAQSSLRYNQIQVRGSLSHRYAHLTGHAQQGALHRVKALPSGARHALLSTAAQRMAADTRAMTHI